MPLINGSGWDPGPAIFVIDLQDTNNKLILKKSFSAYYLFKVHVNQEPEPYLWLVSRSGRPKNMWIRWIRIRICRRIRISGSGTIPLTSGSRSGRPKNMWIRWIRIRIWIRIRNTDSFVVILFPLNWLLTSVVYRHRVDADSDLDQTLDCDADPDSGPTPRFTHVRKSERKM